MECLLQDLWPWDIYQGHQRQPRVQAWETDPVVHGETMWIPAGAEHQGEFWLKSASRKLSPDNIMMCLPKSISLTFIPHLQKGKKCIRTPRVSKPMKFEISGCTTTKSYRPKFCGVCLDGRCCTPHRTTTLPMEFKCPDGQVMKKHMMFIKSCACHYNCPGENDIFEAMYYKKMIGDMAWATGGRSKLETWKETELHLNLQLSIYTF